MGNLLEKFNRLLSGAGDDDPQAEADTDDGTEQLTPQEKRELAWARKENMRRDLLAHGYGGIRQDVFDDL